MLLAAAAIALLTPPSAAGAASDPLAAAVARVTAAQKADNRATAEFDAAQTHYFQLQDDQASTQRSIDSLTGQQHHLAKLARLRAVVAYKRGGLLIDDIFGNGSDILDAARRARMLNDVNARGNRTIANLTAVTSELHARETTLHAQIEQSKSAVQTMRARRAGDRATARGRGEGRDRSARRNSPRCIDRRNSRRFSPRRARKPASTARRAVADARGRSSSPGIGCVRCRVRSRSPTRSDRRAAVVARHKGNDMFSPGGTPLVAVTNGSLMFQSDPLGGLAAYVNGRDGNTYYYAHLSDYVGGGRSVSAGELIGHVGNTGDAAGGPTHLHFEIRPGGPNGRAIDPYATLAAHCG